MLSLYNIFNNTMNNLLEIATHFKIDGDIHQILPLGNEIGRAHV